MAHALTSIIRIGALSIVLWTTVHGWTLPASAPTDRPGDDLRTAEQQALVDFAVSRFEAQGLALPNVAIIFHDSLFPCHGHKGLYWEQSRTLEMCTLDKATMLHELAHAWANSNLSEDAKRAFVAWRCLDSWNDHGHAWKRRGTEHVAETIAWALLDDSNHVKWVETQPDGSQLTTHRVRTVDVTVDDLLENFRTLTGQEPVFRHPDEWSNENDTSPYSPELARLAPRRP